ncbi:MAG: hypothetical protein ACOYLQ_12785 [Hyphomicrobiaceae bacterium]
MNNIFRSRIPTVLLGSLAVAAVVLSALPASANNSCQQSCRAQWNQCRIATKGASSCDAHLQACMQSCIPRR